MFHYLFPFFICTVRSQNTYLIVLYSFEKLHLIIFEEITKYIFDCTFVKKSNNLFSCLTHFTFKGGYDIPKDTMVIINHWALHCDPNYWKDVDKFDPTRYLDTNGKLSSKPESWLPFSMGRRVCLGESVAKPELHLIFSCILQRFKISLAEGTNPVIELAGSDAAIQPANFKITVTERK